MGAAERKGISTGMGMLLGKESQMTLPLSPAEASAPRGRAALSRVSRGLITRAASLDVGSLLRGRSWLAGGCANAALSGANITVQPRKEAPAESFGDRVGFCVRL